MTMANPVIAPEATVYRLSLYHCYLTQLLQEGGTRITSSVFAKDLGYKEETVRRDLSYVGGGGRPGSGYDARTLFDAVQTFLGLIDEYPIIEVGSAEVLSAIRIVFPAERYGLKPVAHYSQSAEDVGKFVNGIEIRPLDELADPGLSAGATVGLLACAPEQVADAVEAMGRGGIQGILVLTPAIHIDPPPGVTITHVRIPCDMKSLACRCRPPLAD